MLVAAVAGGYIGARVARRMDPVPLRRGIIALTYLMTAIVFYRSYT
jgi:uncharacterized protein